MLITQQDLEEKLARDWVHLRHSGRLGTLLPGCSSRQWVDGGVVKGYATLDYTLFHDPEIPRAIATGSSERAILIEKYWSVRTVNGRHDTSWTPSLNVNVINATAKAGTGADCEQVLRQTLLVKQSVWRLHGSWFRHGKPAELYVRAALIAPRFSQCAALIAAFDEVRQMPIRLARYRYSRGGFTFNDPPGLEGMWTIHVGEAGAAKALARELLSDDELPGSAFTWGGTNDGPVFDSRINLKFNNGRGV